MRVRVAVVIFSMYEHDEYQIAHLARAHGNSQNALTSMSIMCSSAICAHDGVADSMCAHMCV